MYFSIVVLVLTNALLTGKVILFTATEYKKVGFSLFQFLNCTLYQKMYMSTT